MALTYSQSQVATLKLQNYPNMIFFRYLMFTYATTNPKTQNPQRTTLVKLCSKLRNKLRLDVRHSSSIKVFNSRLKTYFNTLAFSAQFICSCFITSFSSLFYLLIWLGILFYFIYSLVFLLCSTLVSSHAVFKCALLNKWHGKVHIIFHPK